VNRVCTERVDANGFPWLIAECIQPNDVSNAKLIAAAPDMAEALQDALAHEEARVTGNPEVPQWVYATRAALAKAGL